MAAVVPKEQPAGPGSRQQPRNINEYSDQKNTHCFTALVSIQWNQVILQMAERRILVEYRWKPRHPGLGLSGVTPAPWCYSTRVGSPTARPTSRERETSLMMMMRMVMIQFLSLDQYHRPSGKCHTGQPGPLPRGCTSSFSSSRTGLTTDKVVRLMDPSRPGTSHSTQLSSEVSPTRASPRPGRGDEVRQRNTAVGLMPRRSWYPSQVAMVSDLFWCNRYYFFVLGAGAFFSFIGLLAFGLYAGSGARHSRG